MKTLRILSLISFTLFSSLVYAQDKTETIPVSGNCGMCKNKIEKAAKAAGASFAEWDATAKSLKVTYAAATTNAKKIQEAIAGVGYDTRDVKATDEAYNNLHSCCKYDRNAAPNAKDGACCADGKCTKNAECCKDGVCKDCKDGKCANCAKCADCKDGKCANCKKGEGQTAMNCCNGDECANAGGDCCKSGACEKA